MNGLLWKWCISLYSAKSLQALRLFFILLDLQGYNYFYINVGVNFRFFALFFYILYHLINIIIIGWHCFFICRWVIHIFSWWWRSCRLVNVWPIKMKLLIRRVRILNQSCRILRRYHWNAISTIGIQIFLIWTSCSFLSYKKYN